MQGAVTYKKLDYLVYIHPPRVSSKSDGSPELWHGAKQLSPLVAYRQESIPHYFGISRMNKYPAKYLVSEYFQSSVREFRSPSERLSQRLWLAEKRQIRNF